MTSNTSIPHAAVGAETAIALSSILGELLQADPRTQGSKIKTLPGLWNAKSHDRGYEGAFVEFSEPGQEPRLIEVNSSQAEY